MERRKVWFKYDNENKTLLATFKGNMAYTDDGIGKEVRPNSDILRSDELVLGVAKQCLEEMLSLINGAIENN